MSGEKNAWKFNKYSFFTEEIKRAREMVDEHDMSVIIRDSDPLEGSESGGEFSNNASASLISSVGPPSPTVVEKEMQGAGAMSKQDLFHLLIENNE